MQWMWIYGRCFCSRVCDITLSFDSVPPCMEERRICIVIPSGTPPYNILWETGSTTNSIMNPGYYTVTVSDATGCTVTDSVEVPVPQL